MKDKKREKTIYRTTIAGSVVNVLLLTGKFIAGILGNSQAMIADAVHSLSDFVTDLVVLVFVKISNKPKNKMYHYGHGKFETLATAIIGVTLLAVAIGICWNGLQRIWGAWNGVALDSPGIIALVAAIASIVAKEVLFQWTNKTGKRIKSQILIANAWHHRSDALSSIATALGIAGAIFLGEKWRILDPIAAVLVSFFIVRVAYGLLKKSLGELLERSLDTEIEEEMMEIIKKHPGVCESHNFRTRCIGNNYAIDVDIRVDSTLTIVEAHDIAHSLEEEIRRKYGEDTFIMTHIEPVKNG